MAWAGRCTSPTCPRGCSAPTASLGAGLAIATGAALGAQLDGDGKVAVCFFGDGAANQGVLMETLNIAAVWGLPVIFVCENNTFSEFTPSREITAGRIGDRARAFDMPTRVIDGNDVVLVWQSARELIAHARAGGGPSFLQADTYRIHGHMERERFILGEGQLPRRGGDRRSGRRRIRSIDLPGACSRMASPTRLRSTRSTPASSGWSTPPRPPPTAASRPIDTRRACDVRRLGVVTRWSGDD